MSWWFGGPRDIYCLYNLVLLYVYCLHIFIIELATLMLMYNLVLKVHDARAITQLLVGLALIYLTKKCLKYRIIQSMEMVFHSRETLNQ